MYFDREKDAELRKQNAGRKNKADPKDGCSKKNTGCLVVQLQLHSVQDQDMNDLQLQ